MQVLDLRSWNLKSRHGFLFFLNNGESPINRSRRKSRKSKQGMLGWLSVWAPALGSGRDPGIRDQVLHRAPCEEPASPSACVSAFLSVCASHE